ncbi:Acetyl-CoA hydrolase [Schizosaccharomyces pombe]|uniref:Acetyl-CoA hydrolase n=1 Tax=Schizosaccharomyces pombe (strain 972 / ATCC 24843) TaxID=284812 RepID=ACH1_SCHPO|nr:putative acetyl-CoA hydrolase [Schizosaccharomyces pombe]Q9UUJ9.1 RecName: Full=Acetyl-CoA hydrolase; AltName: Full=Acetyl-CoA deacylase; Short=Acetyl-CoA acylase [Schizosaccharomyces pombe 972h-]CAB52573.1 acetyl-CoA hydrolase (predicted) [Schizosaccharomyces pombe]|eukprot:NP_594811.1 putative acetyl-CoA hydrolase [Schizosaccharomyces pombe]
MPSLLSSRIRNAEFAKKIVTDPAKLVPYFKNGDYVGWSGFTGVGYPKMIPNALARHVEENNLQGKLRFKLFVGASGGADTECKWAELNMIERRCPHQVGKPISKGINSGRIQFFDKHLSMFPQDLLYGYYTRNRESNTIDTAIIEATAITEDGGIVPGASVGASPELMQLAEKIIIEVNTAIPSFEGLHDIVEIPNPPHRTPININRVDDRIGKPYIKVDPKKVIGIVEADYGDITCANSPQDETSQAIAGHLVDFFHHEVSVGRLPKNLHPLQSGIGNIANAIIGGLAHSPFKDLEVWTEVLQDTFLPLFDSEKLRFATATSTRFSPQGFEKFYSNYDYYKERILLRPQVISNHPEIIRRLGCIAMNTPVEADIYAHANSTNVLGSRMLNGLGGSADFLRNAKLSIMHTPSVRPSKKDPTGITCIVPMATHVDQTEHDLDILVTEQGLADLRGLSPTERAREVIDKCAHPDYKPLLREYFDIAENYCLARGAGHEPHILANAFKMQLNLLEKGTMKIDHW